MFAERDQREALLRLAARQLGNPVGDLDLPDVPETEQWVPLASTPAGGLYLVVAEADDGDGAVLGIGARTATVAEPALAATVHVPLVRVGGADAGFVVGTAAGTISLAASVDLAGGPTPGGVALDGATLAMAVPTDGTPPSFTVGLAGLSIDGAAPRDLLVDGGRPAGEVLDTALAVLRAMVLDAAADNPLAHLLSLLGMGGDAALPPLPLAETLAAGRGPIVAWLRALASDPSAVEAWLGHLAGLLGLDPLGAVSGDGTAAAPLAVALPAGAAEVAFTIVLGTAAATGDPVLRPGLRVRLPAPAGVPGRAEAAVELAEITVGPALAARPLPAGRAIVHIGPDVPLATGEDPLVATTVDQIPVQVSALEAGLALDRDGRPVLVLAALDVTVGGDTHPVVDLTMPDAVLEVAAGALDEVIDRLLAALGASDEATALLALLGLRRPGSLDPGAAWPHAVGLPAFFADPLGALAGFHAEVLGAGDWGTLAVELARLLGVGPAAAVAGAGSEDDPWTVPVATDAIGSAALAVWGGGGTRLHLGLRTRPSPLALSAPVELRPALDLELLSLELAPGDGAEALPGIALTLAVGDGLSIDLGVLALEVGSVAAGVHWRRGSGLSIRIAVADAVAVVDATRVPLPIPDYDSAAPPPALPDDFPWPVITRLLGDALLTRGVAWLEGLATLTRWDRSLPTVVTFPAAVPVGDLPGLPVERLPLDPAGVVRDWVAELLRDVEGVAAAQLAGWLGALASGTAPGGGPFEAQVGGGGTAADPYAVGLGTAAGAAELLAWFEPDGSTLVGVPGLVLPPELTGPLDLLEGDPPDPEALAALLREAARSLPELAPVADGRPGLGAGLAELLARLADSDGLVPAAAQRAPGAAEHALEGLTHAEAPLGFDPAAHLPAGADPARVLYVTEPVPGLAEWPHRGAAPLVDLTEPGLAPEALDLSGLTGAGPWFVRLATRAAAGGPAEQAARLGRAVTAALATLPAGATVTVVAHGPAALAARTLASAPGSGIDHLVALAAPLAGATAEFLDEPATGDAARALQALAPMLSAEARENPFAADGLALVDLLGALLDPGPGAAFPLADYRLAGPAEALPGSVGATTIAVTFGAGSAARAIASLVRQAISSALERLRSDRPADAIGLGARVRLGTDQPASGRVEARAQLRADLHRFRLRDGATEQSLPRVVGTLQLRRTDGWLAGGPRLRPRPDRAARAPAALGRAAGGRRGRRRRHDLAQHRDPPRGGGARREPPGMGHRSDRRRRARRGEPRLAGAACQRARRARRRTRGGRRCRAVPRAGPGRGRRGEPRVRGQRRRAAARRPGRRGGVAARRSRDGRAAAGGPADARGPGARRGGAVRRGPDDVRRRPGDRAAADRVARPAAADGAGRPAAGERARARGQRGAAGGRAALGDAAGGPGRAGEGRAARWPWRSRSSRLPRGPSPSRSTPPAPRAPRRAPSCSPRRTRRRSPPCWCGSCPPSWSGSGWASPPRPRRTRSSPCWWPSVCAGRTTRRGSSGTRRGCWPTRSAGCAGPSGAARGWTAPRCRGSSTGCARSSAGPARAAPCRCPGACAPRPAPAPAAPWPWSSAGPLPRWPAASSCRRRSTWVCPPTGRPPRRWPRRSA